MGEPGYMPLRERAEVPFDKITRYLLDPAHMDGGSKAAFLLKCGFSATRPEELAAALREHARMFAAVEATTSTWGTKYVVDGPLRCPDGSTPVLRSVWIIETGGMSPRLVTAHPLRR